MIDVVKLVRSGRCRIEWSWVLSEHEGHKLAIAVFRDAAKFDDQPDMTWSRKPLTTDKRNHGMRLPATACEMQVIADFLSCMLMTPKVVDLLWKEAGETGVQFEPVVNVRGRIVANSDVNDVHNALETAVAEAGGDPGGTAILSSVGKYWVLSNRLLAGKFGERQAINYGWFTKGKGNGRSVTGVSNIWQTPGAAHDDGHLDPSQVIRLMYRWARILRRGSVQWEDIDLHTVAQDPNLSCLISHEGPLKVLRQQNVPEPHASIENGIVTLPATVIQALPKSRWEDGHDLVC